MKAIRTRLLNPIVWRIPGLGARKLFGFALAEQGSMLDLHAAATKSTCAKRRAAYLRHMLDEARHASIFAKRSAEWRLAAGRASLGFPAADTDDLFSRLGEVRFLAFVHRGETRGRQQFEAYRDWFSRRGDSKTAGMFDAIIADECRHESYTLTLLIELAGGPAQARSELRRAAAWEAWRIWRRFGRAVAERMYVLLMVILYGATAPLALWLSFGARTQSVWKEVETFPAPVHPPD